MTSSSGSASSSSEIETAVVDARAEVAKIADLLPAQSDAAERRVALAR